MNSSGRKNERRDIDAGFLHDLNNLLARMSHSSEVGLSLSGLPREDLIRLLSQAYAAARTAIDLVAAYQSAADPVRGFDLRDLLSRTAEAMSNGHTHRISVDVPDQPILTREDPEPLTRVLLNLVGNARDAAGDLGQIALSLTPGALETGVAEVEIGYRPTLPFAILSVSDSGPGIPKILIDRIWERGFTTKGQGGSGQGLAVVRDLIERQGAGLVVETGNGAGTTFRVYWPLRSGLAPISRLGIQGP